MEWIKTEKKQTIAAVVRDEDDDADIIAMGSLPMGDVFLTQHSMISISFTCWKDERGS